jgi:hypothetical protein
MEVFLFNCFLSAIFALFFSPSSGGKRKIFFMLTYLQLLLFHALRDPFLYPDSQSYFNVYNIIKDNESFYDIISDPQVLFRFEPGYVLFNYFTSIFFPSDNSLFVVSSVIIVTGYLFAVYKYSRSPILSVIIIILYPMIFLQSFFVLRQHLACAIFMFSLPYIERRKFWSFLLILLIAISFHYSALILLPIYWIYNSNYSVLNIRHFPILVFIVFLLRFTFTRIAYDNERYKNFLSSDSNILVPFLFFITTFLYIYFIKQNNTSNDKLVNAYNNYSLLICLSTIGLSLGRLTNYCSFFLCIIISDLFKRLPNPLGYYVAFIFLLFTLYLHILVSSDFPAYSIKY